MIRIEQFLFEYNVEKTQAESLVVRFPNLMFGTTQEFLDYFASQNIRLGFSTSEGVNKPTFEDKNLLLQRFKDFKSSTDYDYVKKYIAEQRKIQSAIDSGNIQTASNLLDGITTQPVDPFFNFIVRKMLTGSETGTLPSESLRSLLDELTKKTKKGIDTTVGVTRDDIGRVISFDNYLRNKGSLRVDLLDERFTLETFNYVVNKEFNQLQDAIDAEQNLLRKAAEFDTLFPDDATGDGVVDNRDLVENLKKLIISDGNSIPALQSKLTEIQEQLKDLNNLVSFKEESIGDLNRIIEELSIQRNFIVDENAVKDETIISLNEVIDATLADLEDKVSQQLTNTTDAFDALATQIESQAKKSEESAAKQLAAFEKAVGGIADALKPVEPEPDPGNPAAEIIQQILKEWDKIYVVSEISYPALSQILDKSGVKKKPLKSEYVFSGPNSLKNSYSAIEEPQQHLRWNNQYKDQFKSLIVGITDEKIAKEILSDVKLKLVTAAENGNTDKNGMYQSLLDVLIAWATDFKLRRGGARSELKFVRDIASEVGLEWPPFKRGNLVFDTPFEDLYESEALQVLGINTDGIFDSTNQNSIFGKLRSGGYNNDVLLRCTEIAGKMLLG